MMENAMATKILNMPKAIIATPRFPELLHSQKPNTVPEKSWLRGGQPILSGENL